MALLWRLLITWQDIPFLYLSNSYNPENMNHGITIAIFNRYILPLSKMIHKSNNLICLIIRANSSMLFSLNTIFPPSVLLGYCFQCNQSSIDEIPVWQLYIHTYFLFKVVCTYISLRESPCLYIRPNSYFLNWTFLEVLKRFIFL